MYRLIETILRSTWWPFCFIIVSYISSVSIHAKRAHVGEYHEQELSVITLEDSPY